MRVSQLLIYPVKGCAGVTVTRAPVVNTGLFLDRCFCVVRADDGVGKVVTQRQCAALALVHVALLDRDGAALSELVHKLPDTLQLSFGNLPPLTLPLSRPASPQQRRCTVWEWSGSAHDQGDAAAAWLSSVTGSAVRLVRFPEAGERRVDVDYAGKGYLTAFSDGCECASSKCAHLVRGL
jgi:uncharacterized protein YcbX